MGSRARQNTVDGGFGEGQKMVKNCGGVRWQEERAHDKKQV